MEQKDRLKSLDKITRAYKRMQGLQRITAALSTAITQRDIARIIFEEGFKVLQAESGDVLLFTDDKREKFEVLVYKGYPGEFIDDFKEKGNEIPLLTYYVAQTKKPLYIRNVENIPNTYKVAKSYFRLTKCSSAVILPLQIQDTVIGVMEFSFHRLQVFTKEDKKFMQTLVNQCAQAFERVTAIENLRKSKEELEVILKNVADGITVQDNTGKLIYANKAAVLSNGYKTVNELLNAPLLDYTKRFDLYDESGKPFPVEKLPGRRALHGEKNPSVTVQFVEKQTREFLWVNIKSTAIYSSEGSPYLVISVMHDMTKEKDIEQRKDDFISMASHELKTPLTTIKVFAQILDKNIIDERSKKILGKMDGQLNKLTSLVSELLDITKIKQGRLTIQKSSFNIRDIIEDVVENMQSITDHRIELQLKSQQQLFADRDRIGQVVTNFISNAIKYSPDNKKIIVSTTERSSELIFSVKDFGIGIPKNEQEKVFDRFYRAEEEQKTYPGLGLGLYISSEIIKQHGGKIWVESEKGKGSTFSFSIPFAT